MDPAITASLANEGITVSAPSTPLSASQFQFWMRYHVAFIDAQSGKAEFAEEGSFPVQPS